jgi:hypothetical protein
MVRLVLRWLDSPWAFELMPGLNKLGRNPTNDFRVSDPSVSSFHAEIIAEGEVIRVRDLGSTNGTFVDDQKIEESLLTPENVLRLGHVRFQLDEVPITPVPHVPAVTPTANAEQVELAPACTYHSSVRAAYRCENCGGAFCQECIKVVGQGKFEQTTICPVCHGQCYPLLEKHAPERPSTILTRLTQTLKIPFHR